MNKGFSFWVYSVLSWLMAGFMIYFGIILLLLVLLPFFEPRAGTDSIDALLAELTVPVWQQFLAFLLGVGQFAGGIWLLINHRKVILFDVNEWKKKQAENNLPASLE